MLQAFMSYLDFPTLELLLTATALLSFVAMVVLWRLNPSEKGPVFWAACCLCITLVVPARPFLRHLGPFVFLAVMGFPLALLLGLEGILRFRGVGGERIRRTLLPLLFLVFAVTSHVAGSHAGMRALLNDGFMTIMLFLSAYFMVGERGDSSRRSTESARSGVCCSAGRLRTAGLWPSPESSASRFTPPPGLSTSRR